jgi:predicted transcriptional regulator
LPIVNKFYKINDEDNIYLNELQQEVLQNLYYIRTSQNSVIKNKTLITNLSRRPISSAPSLQRHPIVNKLYKINDDDDVYFNELQQEVLQN